MAAPPLPTDVELEGHLRQHWDGWGERFARFSGRQGEAVELIGVSNATCSYTYDTPECWLEVTGRFASGAEVRQRMFSQFERDEAGKLVEVIVMWHERRR